VFFPAEAKEKKSLLDTVQEGDKRGAKSRKVKHPNSGHERQTQHSIIPTQATIHYITLSRNLTNSSDSPPHHLRPEYISPASRQTHPNRPALQLPANTELNNQQQKHT
jgi:hypothetical protein